MLYRVIRSISAWFPIVMLWVYVVAILVAISLMFVLPIAPLFMLFAGLASLGLVALVMTTLRMTAQMLARRSLAAGVCPACSQAFEVRPAPHDSCRCKVCGAEFTETGSEIAQSNIDSGTNQARHAAP